MVKIAFHIDQLCIRGTSVALYDYAKYNQELLNGKSVIIIPENSQNDLRIVNKFLNHFELFIYKNIDNLEKILQNEKVDNLYCIKYGTNDRIFSKKIKTIIHCVFDMSEPHGDIYCGVSKSLSNKYGKDLFVPHMISLKPGKTENFRKELGILDTDIVFGRYGGFDTFDLLFCINVINKICDERKDIYFLFANTPKFSKNKNIIYIDVLIEDSIKNKFISTCDAFLECNSLGHSFGLALGEFSVNNKPIIVFKDEYLWNTEHIKILGEKGIYFETEQEFQNILKNFDKETYKNLDLNCYKEYTPEKVMKLFSNAFI